MNLYYTNYPTLGSKPHSGATHQRDLPQPSDIGDEHNANGRQHVKKPKLAGFMCPCGKCSVTDFLKNKCTQSSSQIYPFIDTENLTEYERYELYSKLNEEIQAMLSEFSNLIKHVIESFKERVSLEDIKTSILTKFGISEDKETINEFIDVLVKHGHLSFFNYGVIEHLVKQYGTKTNDNSLKGNASCSATTVSDQDALEDYKTKFIRFCNRSVFEAPLGVFARTPPSGKIIAFKATEKMVKGDHPKVADVRQLPTTLELSSELLNLSLNDTINIHSRIVDCLGLRDKWSLVFLGALKGCVQLRFSISMSLFHELKPRLSTIEATILDRETGLSSLEASGIYLLCGPPGKPNASKVTNDSYYYT